MTSWLVVALVGAACAWVGAVAGWILGFDEGRTDERERIAREIGKEFSNHEAR